MKLNWFFSRLNVLLCSWAVLSIGILQVRAAPHPPLFQCPGHHGILEPCTGDGGLTYFHAVTDHVVVSNVSYGQQQGPTQQQVSLAASALIAYAVQLNQNGLTAAVQAWLLDNIQQYYSFTPNGQSVYTAINPFGNSVPLSKISYLLANVAPSERQFLVGQIQTNGLLSTLYFMAHAMQQFSGIQEWGISPGTARTIFDGMQIFGTILATIDPPMGVMFVIGGMAGVLYMDNRGI